MNALEIFSKKECSLCDEAKVLIHQVNRDFGFTITETTLSLDDSRFARYERKFPVIVASNGGEVSGKITEEQLRQLFLSLTPPPRIFYVAKFLEALAIVGVCFGFMYGLMGDMWMDLYFFLGGIVVFLVGWSLETWEKSKRIVRGAKVEGRSAKYEVRSVKFEGRSPNSEARGKGEKS